MGPVINYGEEARFIHEKGECVCVGGGGGSFVILKGRGTTSFEVVLTWPLVAKPSTPLVNTVAKPSTPLVNHLDRRRDSLTELGHLEF